MRKNCSVVVENYFEPCVLYLLMKKSSYGYELFNEFKKNSLCVVNIGNLYRKLGSLSKNGCITKQRIKGTEGPDKTVYSITVKGKKHLATWIDHLEKQNETIHKLITNYHQIYDSSQ